MLTSIIQFPDIGTEIFAVDIGSFRFALRWYALAYIVGLLIGWRICVASVPYTHLTLPPNREV